MKIVSDDLIPRDRKGHLIAMQWGRSCQEGEGDQW